MYTYLDGPSWTAVGSISSIDSALVSNDIMLEYKTYPHPQIKIYISCFKLHLPHFLSHHSAYVLRSYSIVYIVIAQLIITFVIVIKSIFHFALGPGVACTFLVINIIISKTSLDILFQCNTDHGFSLRLLVRYILIYIQP